MDDNDAVHQENEHLRKMVHDQELELEALRTLCATQRVELRAVGRRDDAVYLLCQKAMENCASMAAQVDELAEVCQRALFWANQNHAQMTTFMHVSRRTLERTIALLEDQQRQKEQRKRGRTSIAEPASST